MRSHSESQSSSRERSRQPKQWEHTIVKAGDGADLVASEGEDDHAGSAAVVGGGAKVEPERRLTIRSGRHEVIPPARAEEAGVEAGHEVAALVLERNGWHGSVNIVGEQGNQRIDIGGFVRADEFCYERLLGG